MGRDFLWFVVLLLCSILEFENLKSEFENLKSYMYHIHNVVANNTFFCFTVLRKLRAGIGGCWLHNDVSWCHDDPWLRGGTSILQAHQPTGHHGSSHRMSRWFIDGALVVDTS